MASFSTCPFVLFSALFLMFNLLHFTICDLKILIICQIAFCFKPMSRLGAFWLLVPGCNWLAAEREKKIHVHLYCHWVVCWSRHILLMLSVGEVCHCIWWLTSLYEMHDSQILNEMICRGLTLLAKIPTYLFCSRMIQYLFSIII